MPKYLTENTQFSLPQVILIVLIYFIALRLIASLMMWLIALYGPGIQPHISRILEVMPLPFLIVLLPILLAALIIWLTQASKGYSTQTETSWKLLQPVYSVSQLMTVLRLVTMIWLAIFVLQLVIWFSVSQLHH